MTAEVVAGIAGFGLSLVLSYFPFIKDQFNKLTGDYKRTVMGGAILLSGFGGLVWQCGGLAQACVVANWQTFALATLLALAANQGGYVLLVQGKADKSAAP